MEIVDKWETIPTMWEDVVLREVAFGRKHIPANLDMIRMQGKLMKFESFMSDKRV
jgi:hypothetical protein